MSKPIVEMTRNRDGVPVLGLFNLSPEHFDTLNPILRVNGTDVAHDLRANAGAHLESWNPGSRLVTVELTGPDPWMFVHYLCNGLGISSGKIPNVITDYVGE